MLLAILGAAAVVARRAGARPWWAVPVAGIVLQVPHAIVVWHGDTMDTARHALVVGVTLRVCALLLLLFAINGAIDQRNGPVEG